LVKDTRPGYMLESAPGLGLRMVNMKRATTKSTQMG